VTGTSGPVCTIEFLDLDNKVLRIAARGILGSVNTMNVTIPNELLSGVYKVTTNGADAEFSKQIVNANATRISVMLNFTDYDDTELITVQITGTEVIPEFGSMYLIVAVGSLASAIVLLSRYRWGRG
jgi:hypothetical protein